MAEEWHAPTLEGYDLTVVDFYGLSESDLESYIEDGYQYLIVSSFIRDTTLLSPEENAHKQQFYAGLKEKAEIVAAFKPYSGSVAPPYMIDQVLGPITYLDQLDRPGPTIEVYRLPQS